MVRRGPHAPAPPARSLGRPRGTSDSADCGRSYNCSPRGHSGHTGWCGRRGPPCDRWRWRGAPDAVRQTGWRHTVSRRRRHTAAPRPPLRGGGGSWQGLQGGREFQGVERAHGLLGRHRGDMEVETRRPETRMPEEELDAPEVDTGFEEMRREGMPQEM